MNPQAASSTAALQNAGNISVGGSVNPQQPTTNPIQGSTAATTGNINNPSAQIASNQSSINALTSNANNQSSQIASLLQQIQAEEQANVPGVAPTLDLNALNAQAQSQAQSTVNPLYTQYMNKYLQTEAADQQAAQAQNTLNLQGEQAGLANTLAVNTQAQNYAGQQNAAQQGNINVEAANYQQQSGLANTAKVQALQSANGSGGLSQSGYGQGQLWQAENQRNIADAAQQGQFQYQRNTANMSTQDTFAQLAQSSLYAKTGEAEQEAQTNFNLNDYLRQAAANDQAYTQSLQTWEQQAQTSTAQSLLAQSVQGQLQNYTGKTYAAGEQAYAPQLTTTSAPSAPDINSYLSQLTPGTGV
jgi:hypothetical protein